MVDTPVVTALAMPLRALTKPLEGARTSWRRRAPLFDPGWLFLVAGVVLMSFTLLIPAFEDLEIARHNLKRMQAVEHHRIDRIARYHEYLAALERGDEGLVLSLAAMQLNKAPAGRGLLLPAGDISKRTASVFGSLEPAPLVLAERHVERSMLEALATAGPSRLVLLGFAGLCVLIGLLPPSRGQAAGAATA